jgi:hypothetical protein
MEEFTETEPSYLAERSYPSISLGTLVLVNGPLLGLVSLLLVAANHAEGYLGGLGQILAIWGLMGQGALLNLVLSGTAKGSRVGYLIMAALYGGVFAFFMWVFSHMGNLKPGG